MSGWNDKMPDDTGGVRTEAAGTFDTANMSAALPTGENGKDLTTADGWVERTAIDYSLYGPDAMDARHDWEGNARVYEWDGEEGDLGPEVPELERDLFGDQTNRECSTGIDFKKITDIEVVQEGPIRISPVFKFKDAGLHPAMLKNIELSGYDTPTPIQSYCLPAIHKGYDVIGIAQTGSGKTAAFLIPVINKLMGKAKKLAAPRPNPLEVQAGIARGITAEPLVVVVSPTRELAVQIFNEARKLCYRSMLRPGVVYGGGPFREQANQICMGCDILVATPGRLIHFMQRPEYLSLKRVKYMIIDEADEMLADSWNEDLDRIITGGDQEEGNIKYLLFSATFPKRIRDLAKNHLAENHVRFRVGRAGSTHGNIRQDVVEMSPANKKQGLHELLVSIPPGRTIVFVNAKQTADELDDFLFNTCRLPCTSMHSDRTQREREDALRAFRGGKTPILIATGITARGIDVRNVAHVINYDLPSMDHGGIEEYTHRIGRTGRIGHKGLATSFFTDRDEPIASVLTRTLLETDQDIPEFLSHHVPADHKEKLKFEEDSDWEEDADGGGDEAGGDAWGASPDAAGDSNGDAWGASNGGGDTNGGAWGATPNADDKNGGAWGANDTNGPGHSDAGAWGSKNGNGNAKQEVGWNGQGEGW